MYMYSKELVQCRILRIVDGIHCNQSIQRFKDVLDVQGKCAGICKIRVLGVCICISIQRHNRFIYCITISKFFGFCVPSKGLSLSL
jgi:hypothetical protein